RAEDGDFAHPAEASEDPKRVAELPKGGVQQAHVRDRRAIFEEPDRRHHELADVLSRGLGSVGADLAQKFLDALEGRGLAGSARRALLHARRSAVAHRSATSQPQPKRRRRTDALDVIFSGGSKKSALAK